MGQTTAAIKADFKRVYSHTSYKGSLRKTLFTLFAPGFQAVAGYRITRWLMQRHIPIIGAVLQRLVEVWTGISIPPEARIGAGLLIHHFGGIVINGDTVMGEQCTLHHGVTIGNRVSGGPSPKLGDRVLIGVGAAVLGDITIGNDAQIGANAVVLRSVPDGGVAAGIPARVVRVIKGTGDSAAEPRA